MTREEAIKEFESELKWAELNTYPYISKQKIEADKIAIKALEQGSILDKIRTEIKDILYVDLLTMRVEILQIIDKYKEESEE